MGSEASVEGDVVAPLTAAALRELVAEAGVERVRDLTDVLARALVEASDVEPPLRIGEVADFVGVSAHALRWYESVGLVRVPRDEAGNRSYDLEAIGRVVFITRLRLTDMPVAAIRDYMDLVSAGEHTVARRRQLLEEHREKLRKQLDELAFSAAVLDYKIAEYGGTMPDTTPGAQSGVKVCS